MWVTPSKRDCYGQMFPDLEKADSTGQFRGKMFSVAAGASGQLNVVEADLRHWDRRQECHYYRHCHDLGMAKLASSQAHLPGF